MLKLGLLSKCDPLRNSPNLTTLSVVAAALARDDPFPPSAGLIVQYVQPKGNDCVSSTSYCVLVGSRAALRGDMGGDGPRPYSRGKGGGKLLLFLRFQTRVSVETFCAYLFLSSPPNNIYKRDQQKLTSVAVPMAVPLSPWCIAVWLWSFVLILCYFEYLARFRTFSCVFVQYNTNQIRYRDFTH